MGVRRARAHDRLQAALTQEVHADEATYASWVRDLASEEDKELIATRLGTTPEKAGFASANRG